LVTRHYDPVVDNRPHEPLAPTEPRNPVSLRAILLGLFGAVFICGLTPYNDYALNNTFLVGNNLPIGVVMGVFVFTLAVNGPLSRWAPRWRFTSGEMSVAFAMSLVSCALPSSGLMRYFAPSLVAPFFHARSNGDFLDLLERLHLPRWILPDFKGKSPHDWMLDPLVTGYIGRWTEDAPLPFIAWIRPAITWGIFFAALYTALLCMAAIVRRQWFENERLAFPLAQIQLALVEQPEPGQWLGGVMRKRPFWIAFFSVFCLHLWNGLSQYRPGEFPQIPVRFDLSSLMGDEPWSFTEAAFQHSTIFFTVLGVTYFLPSSVSFSLWAFYILNQSRRMVLGTVTGDPAIHGWQEQHMGGLAAYLLAVLWVGRDHWKLVIRQALRGARGDEPRGRYLSLAAAAWGLIGAAIVMIGWLCIAGCSVGGATTMVLLLLLLFFMIGRIIAETGLVQGQLQVPIQRPFEMIVEAGFAPPVSLKTFFFAGYLETVHYDFREVVSVYAPHAMKVADQTIFGGRAERDDDAGDRRIGRRFILALALALAVGYPVSLGSTLWTEYTYAATKDVQGHSPINEWGITAPASMLMQPTTEYAHGRYDLDYSPPKNFAFGFVLVGVLSFLRLRYTWWPMHPIGFIMLHTFPGNTLWFSIMLGWLAKTIIVRFGGSKAYVQGKVFFLGLIAGESLAAGFWLAVGIVLSLFHVTYRPVDVMPG
jgi:hypothetical protein